MMQRILFTALLLALAPLPAHAQGNPGPEERIEAALRRAEAAGVPASLLESKVAEGKAKGVPMERIATAVERRLVLLARAREVMGGPASASELRVAADALAAGVSGEVLDDLARTAPANQRAVAIAVLTQLVQQGEASERALQRVQVAMARGPEALRRLPALGGGRGRQDALAEGQGAAPPKNIPGPPGVERGRSGLPSELGTTREGEGRDRSGGKRPPRRKP
jgi:hypothetical protein